MLCAAIGGPFATIAYVVALNSATAAGNPGVIVPIAALNCAIGAVLGRILFKQSLGAHKIAGVLVCSARRRRDWRHELRTWAPRRCSAACSPSWPHSAGASRAAWPASAPCSSTTCIGIAIRQLTAGLLELVIAFPVLAPPSAVTSPACPRRCRRHHRPGHRDLRHFGPVRDARVLVLVQGHPCAAPPWAWPATACTPSWGPFFIWIVLGVLNIGGMSADYPPCQSCSGLARSSWSQASS